MKRILRFVCLLSGSLSLVAAAAQSVEDMVEPPLMKYTPTPQTLGFLRYGNTPVDYYTGTAQVDVPLYDYSDPDFRLSFSAGCTSGGFNPQRQTGILGLNWTLNGGGMITREIRGVDDLYVQDNAANGWAHGFMTGNNSYQDSDLLALRIGTAQVEGYGYSHREVDADIFHFNFMGHSGTFHMDGQRRLQVYGTNGNNGTYEIALAPRDNTERSMFTIRTADGYKYTFGGREDAMERSVAGNFDGYGRFKIDRAELSPIVTWFLTEVEAPSGRKIEFSYDYTYSIVTMLTKDTKNPYFVTSFSIGFNECSSATQAQEHYRRASVIRTSYLKSVAVSDAVRIDLDYSLKGCCDVHKTGRVGAMQDDGDIAQELKKLDAIRVSSGANTLRTCNFAYRIRNERLVLDSIGVSGVGTYKMTYYEPCDFPDMTTPDVDFWGYYNGRNNCYDDICPMSIVTQSDLPNYNESIVKPIKNPDYRYGILGCLKSIQYPTRGFTTFEYEANRARYIVLKRERADIEFDPRPNSLSVADSPDTPPSYNPLQPDSTKYLARLNNYDVLFDSDETGGVRIRRITDNDANGGFRVREYEYLDSKSRQSGTVLHFQRFNAFKLGIYDIRVPLLQYPANTFDKSHIGYSAVREKFADGSSVFYQFSDYKSDPDDYQGQCKKELNVGSAPDLVPDADFMNNILREPNSQSYRRGRLLLKTSYDAAENKVLREQFEYADRNKTSDNNYSAYVVASGRFNYSVKKFTEDYRQWRKTVTEYFDRDSVRTQTVYTFNDLGQLKKSESHTTGGTVYYTYTEYLHETSHAFNPLLLPKAYVSREIAAGALPGDGLIVHNQVISAAKITYAQQGTMVKPSVASVAELTEGVLFRETDPFAVPLSYKDKITYEVYDSNGNPVQIKDASGVRHSFVWGYGGIYPVARASGATYAQMKAALSLTGDRPLAAGLSSEQTSRLYAIPGAFVDVYDYTPHVGLIRHTDPSGRELVFEYDAFGRLTGTADLLGPIQKYSYNF